ncbi:hypothetical protein N8I77_001057 [Diaporthe amygdali]|uniref:Uncharacterized protein n=1 Tax=Phomopsis amygdali TaxID=1214568 RepID=A0AAD9SPP3_PHOAM|nr:hypothetical protein N8I77_001057 [Diaporthe amygdali]
MTSSNDVVLHNLAVSRIGLGALLRSYDKMDRFQDDFGFIFPPVERDSVPTRITGFPIRQDGNYFGVILNGILLQPLYQSASENTKFFRSLSNQALQIILAQDPETQLFIPGQLLELGSAIALAIHHREVVGDERRLITLGQPLIRLTDHVVNVKIKDTAIFHAAKINASDLKREASELLFADSGRVEVDRLVCSLLKVLRFKNFDQCGANVRKQ